MYNAYPDGYDVDLGTIHYFNRQQLHGRRRVGEPRKHWLRAGERELSRFNLDELRNQRVVQFA